VLGIARTFCPPPLALPGGQEPSSCLRSAACALVVVPLPIFAARLFFVSEVVLLEIGGSRGQSRPQQPAGALSQVCLVWGWRWACAAPPFPGAMAADWIGDTVVNTSFKWGSPSVLCERRRLGLRRAGALLSAPFVASASFLGYIDLRTRKEGWDIQLRLAASPTAKTDSESDVRIYMARVAP